MNNNNNKKRHGFHLQCQSCGCRTTIGGIENAKHFAKIIKEYKGRHLHHAYELKQSYHAAELQHFSQTQTTRQTASSTSYSDFTNNSIPAASFTADKKYLLVVTAVLDHSSTSSNAKAKMLHANTDFDDADSTFHSLEPVTATTDRMTYSWWHVFLQPAAATEEIKCVIAAGASGTTVGIDQFTLTAIKLSDDLVEDTDWKFNIVDASTSLTTSDSTTNNASVTVTPTTAGNSWLCLTKSKLYVGSTTRSFASRMVRSGEASSTGPFQNREGRDTLERLLWVNMRVIQFGAASNTIEEKSYSLVANSGSRAYSAAFVLNLSKLRNIATSYDDASVLDLAATDYGTNVATVSLTPAVTGDIWTWGMLTVDYNGASINSKTRLQVNDNTSTEIPANITSDNYTLNVSTDAIDERAYHSQGIINLTASTAHKFDLDASVSSATAGRGARAKSLFAVTMELQPTGQALLQQTVESVGITEASNLVRGRIQQLTESIGITEAVSRVVGRNVTINEAIGITETINRLSNLSRVTNETVGITEAVNYARALNRIISESVGITEAINHVIGLTKQVNETVGIAEALTRLVAQTRTIDESVGITEAINTILGKSKVVDETVGITEAISTLMSKTRVINESIGITESVFNIVGKIRAINEDVGIGEAYNIARNLIRIQEEQVQVTEVLNRVTGLNHIINESVGILEDAQRNLSLTRVVNETQGLTESLTVALGKIRVLNESVDITELTNAVVSQVANQYKIVVDESLNISEAINYIKTHQINKVVNEQVDISENTIRLLGLTRIVNENVELTETLNRLANIVRTVNEQAHITELTERVRALVREINETESIEEAVSAIRGLTQIVNETISLPESQISTTGKAVVVSEVVGITENVLGLIELQAEIPQPTPSQNMALGTSFRSKKRRRFPTFRRLRYEQVQVNRQQPRKYQVETFKRREQQVIPPEIERREERIEEEEKPQTVVATERIFSFRYNIGFAPSVMERWLVTRVLLEQLNPLANKPSYSPPPPKIVQEVTKRFTSSYNIHEEVASKRFKFNYNIRQEITFVRKFTYNIRQEVVSYPIRVSYNVYEGVTKQPLKVPYSINTTVTSNRKFRYDIVGADEYKELLELLDLNNAAIDNTELLLMVDGSSTDIGGGEEEATDRS